jgi:hypothetical protein
VRCVERDRMTFNTVDRWWLSFIVQHLVHKGGQQVGRGDDERGRPCMHKFAQHRDIGMHTRKQTGRGCLVYSDAD